MNIIEISLVFIGTVVGAGFASGQEIYQFFLRYGRISIWGVLLSGLLFGFICAIVLCKIQATGASNITEYFHNLNNKKVINFFNITINLFMLASFCVMVSASGALFDEQLSLPHWLGAAFMCGVCMVVFFYGAEGIVKVNSFLTPVMILGILFLGCFIYFSDAAVPAFAMEKIWDNFLVSSILYASYNTLTIVVIMTAIHSRINCRFDAFASAFGGGAVLCIIALILWAILYNSNALGAEIPMLSAVGEFNGWAKFIYLPMLYIAMLTTAVANGYGVINNININPKVTNILVCTIGAMVSSTRFSVLVGSVYSFFGYIGIAIMIITIADGLSFLKKEEKRSK